ncbi:hypothetical protein BSKO_00167 [Bryopsis sp. KO-2023]|nr:hypothetical protein BSKO_00167 [Bryopsis sp. KO-2023]
MLRFCECSNFLVHPGRIPTPRFIARPPRCRTLPANSRSNGAPTAKETQIAAVLPVSPPSEEKQEQLRELYDGNKKIESGDLKVSDGHTLYYEVHGNPEGPAALFLHGGPGAGCFENHARFFDPSFWKILLLDQRGCGKSEPTAGLEGNTTQNLVEDIEVLREHLKVESWTLLGGSWGVTLALAYAIAHPNRVSGVVLRGICTMRTEEIDWMYRGGAGSLFPEGWASFLSILSDSEKEDPLASYYKRLTSPDLDTVEKAANRWRRWEMTVMFSGKTSEKYIVKAGEIFNAAWEPIASIMKKKGGEKKPDKKNDDVDGGKAKPTRSISHAQPLLECHYSINGAFLDEPLIAGVDRIRDIPCIGVQGRLDFVCPLRTAFDLSNAWPEMELHVIPMAGHSMYDAGVKHALIEATDRMKEHAVHAS